MKRPAAVRNAIIRSWSDDAAERQTALASLNDMASTDMVDIRTAQPSVVARLRDPSPEVRELALRICEYRADMGADIGMAVPMLLSMQNEPDPELRELVRRALFYANKRLGGLLGAHLQSP
jgi:hypothetical protein